MSKCSLLRVRFQLTFSLAIALALPTMLLAGNPKTTESARLATYDSSTGETSFALSLAPELESQTIRPTDVVIYFDTSASQTGAFRDDSMKALKSILAGLDSSDRVQLYALDLDAVPMTDSFVAADDSEMTLALEKLSDRLPLGSTDMSALVNSATSLLADSSNARNVIYIGDGISRGGIVGDRQFEQLTDKLVRERIVVSSFAIGPERNVNFLAALANHSGGNVFVDTDDVGSTDEAAAGLLTTVRGSVFWPTDIQLPKQINEIFPKQVPPLRSDRDTVLIGSLSERGEFEVTITGEVNGQSRQLSWPVVAENSDGEFKFLPQLLEMARENSGATLPTVGSAGLREMARIILASSQQITQLGAQVLAAGAAATSTGSEQPEQPSSNDPILPSGDNENAAESSKAPPASDGSLTLIDPTVQDQDPLQAGDDRFLNSVDQLKQAAEQRLRAYVNNEIALARDMLATKPDQAIDRLKAMLDTVQRAPDLDSETRLALETDIRTQLRYASVEKQEFDTRVQLAQQNAAIVRSRENLLNELERRESEVAELLNKFNAMMDERNYSGALNVTEAAIDIEPDLQETVAADERSIMQTQWEQYFLLRQAKNRGFVANLYEVEESAIPFAGDPPLVFPDAEEWARKKEIRKKWQNVRLLGNEREEAILQALQQDAKFDYFETRFADVIDELKTEYEIPIVIHESAIENNLDEDQLITLNLAGVSLRSGLRIMLQPYQCTYVVKDEVLYIMSEDAALDNLVINIYNVGDLVAPRGAFGGIGGGGGFGGGGQGGFGGGGGGFGGGGGGFGGGLGGGVFCIQDDHSLGSVKSDINDKPVALSVTPDEGQTKAQAWTEYFAKHHADPSDIRETVRQLVKAENTDEVIAVIEGCMRNNQTQAWMYEAIILAMQVSGAPTEQIERTVMSSVDFSDNVDDLMNAAFYMANNGMEKRAISLLKDISASNPTRPEPFAIAMRAAKRINDREGIKWAALGVLGQAWPDNQDEVTNAFRAAETIKLDLSREGKMDELREFESQLAEALYRDCIIKVTWTGVADLDLYVEEPGGTICSRENPRTTCGGVMMGDEISQKNEEGHVSEYYVLPKGFEGDYRLAIRRVWGEIPTGKVTVEVYRNYRTENETSMKRQVALDDKGAVVLFKLDEGRRTEKLNQRAIETAAAQEFLADRGMLAQQMARYRSTSATRHYISSQEGNDNPQLVNNGRRLRQNVGFQPEVEVFPTGTGMTVQATTADRLYVLVSTPFQLFSDITEVSTFNFVTGETGVTGGGGAGAGAGGAGAGGAGAGGAGGN